MNENVLALIENELEKLYSLSVTEISPLHNFTIQSIERLLKSYQLASELVVKKTKAEAKKRQQMDHDELVNNILSFDDEVQKRKVK